MLRTSPEVAARALGYALLQVRAPSDARRDCIACDIVGCNDDPETFAGLAHLFIFGVIGIFWNPDVEAVTPPWLGDQLLVRQKYSCPFTERLDFKSYWQGLITPANLTAKGGSYLAMATIISQPTTEHIKGLTETAQRKLPWASSAAAIFDRFYGVQLKNILDDQAVNAFMPVIDRSAGLLFNEMKMWLTPAQDVDGCVVPDTYDVGLRNPKMFDVPGLQLVRKVKSCSSLSSDGKIVPSPSQTLLEVQAACAQIAHMSGAAEVLESFYLEQIWKEKCHKCCLVTSRTLSQSPPAVLTRSQRWCL